jgi:release factor glutamine methyltransferase
VNDAPSGPPTGRSSSVARLRAAGCVFAEEEAALLEEAAPSSAALELLLLRRETGEPLEQILGWVAFRGLRIPVAPGVFVPRVRTEWVVDCALAVLPPGAVVLDLCCGSGAIARAIAEERPDVRLLAADLSPTAVACARRTLAGLATVVEGDLFAALPEEEHGRIDAVVVNAPYVPSDAIALMPPEARVHEPRLTLDGGADGLELHRRIAREAPEWLAPHGAVVIEVGEDQAAASASAFAAAGFTTAVHRDDDRDATVLVAVRRRTTPL